MRLTGPARASMVGHARDAAPAEACGLLGGRTEPEPVVTTAIATPNVATDRRSRFEIDPEALLSGREALESAGLDVLGFYHSHPRGPDGPSETDQELALWDGTYTVIVSLAGADPSIGAWIYEAERFTPEPIEVRPAPNGDST